MKAWVQWYKPADFPIGPLPGDLTQNIALSADTDTCIAPGYKSTGFTVDFESVTPPALPSAWSKINVNQSDGDWATSAGTVHPNGIPAHSGNNLVYFNSYTSLSGQTLLYRTAGINMTNLTSTTLTFWVYHGSEYTSSNGGVQVKYRLTAERHGPMSDPLFRVTMEPRVGDNTA